MIIISLDDNSLISYVSSPTSRRLLVLMFGFNARHLAYVRCPYCESIDEVERAYGDQYACDNQECRGLVFDLEEYVKIFPRWRWKGGSI